MNTIEIVTNLYNYDFQYYKKYIPVNWVDVEMWDFSELSCASKKYINTYFNQKRFFDNLLFMDRSIEILNELKNDYKIVIVSSGYRPNLIGKEIWIKNNLPFCDFVGVNLKKHKDKSHIDMKDGLFIDDSYNNLISSNAKYKVCFGDEYKWNKDWKGKRCLNWIEVENYINKIYFGGKIWQM